MHASMSVFACVRACMCACVCVRAPILQCCYKVQLLWAVHDVLLFLHYCIWQIPIKQSVNVCMYYAYACMRWCMHVCILFSKRQTMH